MCMSFVAVGKSLTIVSYVAFKIAALWFWTMPPFLSGGGILVDHWSTISSLEVVFPWTCVLGNRYWETSSLPQSWPIVSMASDLCLPGVICVLSYSGLLCAWKPVLRDFLPAAVPSSCVYIWLPICAFMVFCMLCPVQGCCVPGNQCWQTCLIQSRPVVSMASDLCRHGVSSVVSCSGLLCSWKPVLRYLLPAAVPSCRVYGFWPVPSWCFECCVLFRPVMFLETSVERPPACCSPFLLCLWLLICAVMVFRVLCPVPACCVPGNQCRDTSCLLQSRPVVSMASDVCRRGVLSVVSCSGLLCSWKPVLRYLLPAAVPSCRVYGFWPVPSWCFECCVLFRPVMFLETSVERPPACCSPFLLCLWLLICAVMVFRVLCPVPACCVPGNQCRDTSCLLQSRPVVSMASDVCRRGVLSVVSCSGLLCSWKPVLRYLLSAAVPSCCVYGFWCVPSGCFECCVLFQPVVFLETSVEIPPVCCSPVLLCLWLLMCAVKVFWVLCPVPACCVPGNQCCDTSCLLQSLPVVSMASDVCRQGVLSVVSCSGLLCSWKLVLRYLLPAAVPSCCAYGFWSVHAVMVFWVLCPVPACYVPGNLCWETYCLLQSCPVVHMASDLCRWGFWMLCPVPDSCIPGNQCWETCKLQSCPVVYMAADLLISGVLHVVSCFGLSCSWKPVLRDLHTSVLSCRVYGCRSVHFWCSVCFGLFWPVLFLETSVERPACCSSVLLCQWLLICAVMMFWVLRPVLACLVLAWKPVLRDLLSASVQSCFVYGFWFVLSGCFEYFVLLRPVEFLETSVERHPAFFCHVLLCICLLICAVRYFECCVTSVLFLACCVPGNQCWDTFCLLQSRPVVCKASDLWVLVFWVLRPVLACCVPGNQCRETCLLQSRPVVCVTTRGLLGHPIEWLPI